MQARLDAKAAAALRIIAKGEGLTTSQVIRKCLIEGAAVRAAKPRPRLIGIGCVDFGPGDLATNKKHLKGFGKKWRVDKQGRGKWSW